MCAYVRTWIETYTCGSIHWKLTISTYDEFGVDNLFVFLTDRIKMLERYL